MYFEYYNMEFIGICPHIFVYSDLFRVDADDSNFVWQECFCDYHINFERGKKGIPCLLIAHFGTVLFIHTSLDSIILFSFVSQTVLCSLEPYQYQPLCILLQS